jgi:6-pyruvoyl-tetrahydropterin synthase related domain
VKISFRFCPTSASNTRSRQALFLACAGIAVLPLAWRGVSCGHDFDFHLESWMEVLRQWHQGVLYPHWAASANYGAGEPRFVFYPPLSWMLGALLGATLPWTWTPLAFTLLTLAAMGATCFHMAKEWMPEDHAAIAACLYVVNPYVLFVAYERTAYGELLAAIWIPLLFLYGLRCKPAMPQLALVIAALWLTNAPGAVMGCYALAILVLWTAIAERRWSLLGRAAAGTALGLGLSGFYLVPAIYEQRWVEITRAIGSGMRVEDSFLFEHTGEAFHDQVLHTASWIAIALLSLTAIAAAVSLRGKRNRVPQVPTLGPGIQDASSLHKSFLILAIVITVLLLPISDPLWRHLPELKFLQFPWRWLLVLSLIASTLAALCLRGEATTRRAIGSRAAIILLLACAFSALAWTTYWQPCDDEDNIQAQQATFQTGGFEGTDEYTASPADNGDIQQGLPAIRILPQSNTDEADSSTAENPAWQASSKEPSDARTQISQWNVEHMAAAIDSHTAAFAVLRLMDYPAWRVRLNGQPIQTRPHRDDGLMTIPIAAGHSQIDVQYAVTSDVWTGQILSLLSIILLLALTLSRRHRLS